LFVQFFFFVIKQQINNFSFFFEPEIAILNRSSHLGYDESRKLFGTDLFDALDEPSAESPPRFVGRVEVSFFAGGFVALPASFKPIPNTASTLKTVRIAPFASASPAWVGRLNSVLAHLTYQPTIS
jgi:hypothetical protein